jgi:oligo-1,6-glucosidase
MRPREQGSLKKKWWQSSVVYQIYPRSFADSNGDGVGDLRGILQKLDYLQALGVDVVWLSPVYQSPNDDNGYDISDYQAINPEFGTMPDWEALLAEMHRRGLKLMMDLVVNHTSDEHRWFAESRRSKDNPYRDYYIWRPGKNGREPNNWRSAFGGSAWQLDPATGEYYLHLFSRKQPDFNWENPRVREEVYQMMRWWLDKGVDGFRMDVINMISKAPGLPDANCPKGERYQFGGRHYVHGPRLNEFLHEMKREVLSKYDVLTVGEMPMVTSAQAAALTHPDTGQLSMVFQFEHMDLDNDPAGSSKFDARRFDLADLKRVLTRWQKDLEEKGWNSLYLANHDQPRAVSRFGDDGRYRVESAKLLATLLHLQHGTPYIYQGEEIGMTNVKFDSIDDYRDIETLNIYREMVREKRLAPRTALRKIHAKSRDNARTPMQWDDTPNAAFTTGQPWIRLNRNYGQINVKNALANPNSIFHYYQKLIRLRKANPVIVYGRYDLLAGTDPRIYAFTRTLDDDQLLVILNFSADSPVFALPAGLPDAGRELLISNYEVDAAQPLAELTLRPWEARVYRLPPAAA